MRQKALLAVAVCAVLLTSCTQKDSEPSPKKADFPEAVVPAEVQTIYLPLGELTSMSNLIGKAAQEQPSLPKKLPVKKSQLWSVPILNDVKIDSWELSSDGQSGVLCLTHTKAPVWVAQTLSLSDETAQPVIGLSGECDINLDEESRSPEEWTKDGGSPKTAEELLGGLYFTALELGKELREKQVENIAQIYGGIQEQKLSLLYKDANVSYYKLYEDGEFLLCVTGPRGGWARYDSTDPETALASLSGICEYDEQGPAAELLPSGAPSPTS